ncbi:MAG: tetrahydrofolate synthase [Treponema sp.]|jgi:dihydrofolate synthase/folylpolyglutamate synthase|nr:tetrahydrofolate synthase [Treponema sp.]
MGFFSGSAEVFAWLDRFINLERELRPGFPVYAPNFAGSPPPSPKGLYRLDRMEALAAMAGHPEKSAPVIHTAGSKGKGSVTGMISAVLEEAGLSPARYSSPHVLEYRERIASGNRFFDETLYAAAGDELRELADKWQGTPESGMGEPTFFEFLTLYFFLCARRARSGIMAVETGLGGRLDATNIVDPLVSVITAIELEHTGFLGNTIEAVAGEKAGIIKRGKPLVLAEQPPEALDVFRAAAAARESPLFYLPGMAEITGLKVHREGTSFTLNVTKPGFFSKPLDLFLPIPGKIQAENGALAALALKTALPSIDAETIRRGFEKFRLPARFERIREEPPVIVDGAHTPRSVELCAETFAGLYGGELQQGILLFGCAADKDAGAMAAALAGRFSRIIITAPGSFKPSCPETVFGAFQQAYERNGSCGTPPVLIKDTRTAVKTALELGEETGLPLLGTGSFYLAGTIKACLNPGVLEMPEKPLRQGGGELR